MADERTDSQSGDAGKGSLKRHLKTPLGVIAGVAALVGIVTGTQTAVKSCSTEYPLLAEGDFGPLVYPPSVDAETDQLEELARAGWEPAEGHWTRECHVERKDGRRTIDVEEPCPPDPLRKRVKQIHSYDGWRTYKAHGEVEIKNIGTKRIHNVTLLLPLHGEYAMQSPESAASHAIFANTIVVGDLQPSASVHVAWWATSASLYDLEDHAEVHFDEGSKSVAFASSRLKWVGPLAWTLPLLSLLLYMLVRAIYRTIYASGVTYGVEWQKRKAASDLEKAIQLGPEPY